MPTTRSPADRQKEWRQRHLETQTVPVRLYALHERALDAVIQSHTATWQSTGGCQYRKTRIQMQFDRHRADLLCSVLADYVDDPLRRTPSALYMELIAEALERGELVPYGNGHPICPPGETDNEHVRNLPVRGYQ